MVEPRYPRHRISVPLLCINVLQDLIRQRQMKLPESAVAPPHQLPGSTPVTVRNDVTAQNKRRNRWSEEEHKGFRHSSRSSIDDITTRNLNLDQLPPNEETISSSNTVSESIDCGTSISTTPNSDSSSSCRDRLQESAVATPHQLPEATVRNDDTAQNKKSRKRWSKEEHKEFLRGLKKYGQGYWADISRFMGSSRTNTQVASHAQKFFARQNKIHHSGRSSIYDITMVDEDDNDDEVAALDVERKSP